MNVRAPDQRRPPAWGRRRRRLAYRTAVLIGVAAALAVGLHMVRPLRSINARATDLLIAAAESAPTVTIAAIDDATIARHGRLVDWDRGLHARAIENLMAAGARVIGYDVLFADPAPGDDRLGSALRSANTVLATAFTGPSRAGGSSPDDFLEFEGYLPPLPELAAGTLLGHANLTPDSDGVVRSVPLLVRGPDGAAQVSLAYATFARFFGRDPEVSISVGAGRARLLPDLPEPLGRWAPLETNARLRVGYRGPAGTVPQVSYADLIANRFDPALVAGRAVLVGLTATGARDSFPTVFGGAEMPGVEVHANVLDQLFANRWVTVVPLGHVVIGEILSLALIGLALALRSVRSLLLLGPLLGAAWFGAIVALAASATLVEPFYPAIVIGLTWVNALVASLTLERAERQTIEKLFGRYVSTAVATEAARRVDAGDLSLGGERHDITAMFADVRGFTAMSHGVEPEIAMLVVNQIMRVLIGAVDAHHGVVNKFSGDGLLAVWNVPHPHPDHVRAALAAAVAGLRDWSRWGGAYPGVSDVRFAVGVDTGPAVAGIVGSEHRAEYTVIGDTVNMAARLCGAAPGGSIWVSDAAAASLGYPGELRDEGFHEFKGRGEPMRVWSIDPSSQPADLSVGPSQGSSTTANVDATSTAAPSS